MLRQGRGLHQQAASDEFSSSNNGAESPRRAAHLPLAQPRRRSAPALQESGCKRPPPQPKVPLRADTGEIEASRRH